MFRQTPQMLLIVLLAGLLLMRESREMPGARIEEVFINWLAANATRTSAPAPLTLVEINDSSLRSQHDWPWSPLDFALFLEAALQWQPAVIGIEPVLNWEDRPPSPGEQLKQRQYEKILHERILRAPKIVLGAQLGFPEDPDVIAPLQPVPVLRQIKGSVNAIPEFTVIDQQPREELRLAAALGFANAGILNDGPVHRAPMVFRYRGQVVPSFSLQALMLWMKLTPDDVRVHVGSRIEMGEGISIPIDEAGTLLVDWKAPLPRVGFDDLLLAVEQLQARRNPVVAPTMVRDKLVLLARTDAGARTLDLPTGRKGSPGELLAAAVATVQNGTFIRRVGLWFDACLIAAAMALSWYVGGRRRRKALAFTAVAIVAYLLVGLAIFSTMLVAVPLVLPVGLAAVVALLRFLSSRRKAPGEIATPGAAAASPT